ncbi:MAG: hypothetical protein KUG70_07920 [Rhodobacteraceae bacterium]|nr:hypothetical protein [Paracoccaceae bacterium]
MLKVLKDLCLALLNATLILLALCLFLAWKVANTADNVASNFASNLVVVEPLKAELQAMTGELVNLRQDVAQVLARPGEIQSATLQRIETRLEKVDARMSDASKSISNLSQAPYLLVDYAIETASDSIAQKAGYLRGCVQPQS